MLELRRWSICGISGGKFLCSLPGGALSIKLRAGFVLELCRRLLFGHSSDDVLQLCVGYLPTCVKSKLVHKLPFGKGVCDDGSFRCKQLRGRQLLDYAYKQLFGLRHR